MVNGVIVGLVVDNVDPDKQHRVKVKYPVDGETAPESTWVRILTPMGGKLRGLTILPEVGTEVVIGFAYRTLTPYVIGGVYNGAEDKPAYANEDGKNDHRRFWSRNSHWIDFDDTSGSERIELIATSESKAIYQELHAAKKVLTTKVEKDFTVEAKATISLKCKDFEVDASMTVTMASSRS